MSFIDDIGNLFSGGDLSSQILKTVALGYGLKVVTDSINKDNAKDSTSIQAIDPGVRLQVNPDARSKVPVVYGQSTIGGYITDAQITNNNKTMYYCLTLCEKTGNTGLGVGPDSVISFLEIYRNDQRMVFHPDGITANYAVDRDDNVDDSIDGLIRVYCFNNGSSSPVVPIAYTNGSLVPAYNIFPDWTSAFTMSNLAFAIVRVDYNREKNVKDIGTFKFKLSNSLTQPGDCLYDYMTNTRYGAGIPAEEIYVQ